MNVVEYDDDDDVVVSLVVGCVGFYIFDFLLTLLLKFFGFFLFFYQHFEKV